MAGLELASALSQAAFSSRLSSPRQYGEAQTFHSKATFLLLPLWLATVVLQCECYRCIMDSPIFDRRTRMIAILTLAGLAVTGLFFASSVALPHALDIADLLTLLKGLTAAKSHTPITFTALYFAAYVSTTALCIPLEVPFAVTAGALFGLYEGVFIASFASAIGASLAFLAARHLLRGKVVRTLGRHMRIIDEGIARDGAFFLVNLRLTPIVPFSLCNPLMGLTPMRLSVFWSVSQACMIFATFIFVNAGVQLSHLSSWADIISLKMMVGLASLASLPWLGKYLVSRVKNARRLQELEG